MLVESFVEPEIADEMELIEWPALSDGENQSLAVSISILHDARAERDQAKDAAKRALFIAFTLICFNVISLSMQVSAMSIVIGNCVALLVNALLMKFSKRATEKMAEVHKDALISEIRHLKHRYPKQDEGI